MTRSIRFVFFVAAAATFAADAGAGIPAAPASAAAPDPGVLKVSESVEYHDVDARTLEDFVEALRARPAGDDEAGAAARTRAALQVGYKLVPDDAGCRIVGLGVQLDVVMHLPRWQPPEGLRPAIRGQWERMKTGIELHEQGHRDIALDAGWRRCPPPAAIAMPSAARSCASASRRRCGTRTSTPSTTSGRGTAWRRRRRRRTTRTRARAACAISAIAARAAT